MKSWLTDRIQKAKEDVAIKTGFGGTGASAAAGSGAS